MLTREFKINKIKVDTNSMLDRPIRVVEWSLIISSEDGYEFNHGGKTILDDANPEYFIPYDSVTNAQIEEWVVSKNGGEDFLLALEQDAEETFSQKRIEENTVVAYTDESEPEEIEGAFNISRFHDLIIWESTFTAGQTREDRFPTLHSPLRDFVEEGQWMTKPQVTFITSGSFHLETATGRKYLLTKNTPPRLWHCAITVKWTALEEGSSMICMQNRAKNPMVMYDSERLLPAKGETITVGGDTETTLYIVDGEFEDSDKNKLGAKYMKRLSAGETMTLKASKDEGNIIVASNPRPYEFQVTSVEPEAFRLGAIE